MTKDVGPITASFSLERVHELILDRISAKNPRIYEAGGGSVSFVPSSILNNAHVTVVDIDEMQLQRNKYAKTKILGDIQTQVFQRDSFELIVCYNVIEHLIAPDKAIALFYQALVSGGLLFIAAPNPESFSGWITRVTPHWFHVLYYRYILGYKYAGQPWSVPFPTIFHRIVSPSVLIDFCRNLGFNMLYFCEYKGTVYENMAVRRPVLGKLLNVAVQIANALVLWRKDLRNGDYHIVLEKAPDPKEKF
jgi:2-polyprenyl-3-methyl-5-hydroxy-6-metoxy-1,4-benzoquinol methylase